MQISNNTYKLKLDMKRNAILTILLVFGFLMLNAQTTKWPNIILVMADDQGWGQMGYYNHPILVA